MKFYRKIIKITADDSPNVKYGLAQLAAGIEPTNEILVPGVISWDEYQHRLLTWDDIRQAVGLRAEFYNGPELMLFPSMWLNQATARERVALCRSKPAEAIGVDPGEGGAQTVICCINKYGLKEMISFKTPDTSVIPNEVRAFMRKHPTVSPEKVCFDRGGGGKQHADFMRSQGLNVRTVAFGEPIMSEPKRGMRQFPERAELYEDRYVYKNRRAEMFAELSIMIDPTRTNTLTEGIFAIPRDNAVYAELHRQLLLFPKKYDREGRLVIPPKQRNPGEQVHGEKTLIEIIGNSPDEADALACAGHAMLHKPKPQKASVS